MLYGLIFLNGDFNDGPAVQAALAAARIAPQRLIVAVDGGLRHALVAGFMPDLVIGDMDSVDPAMIAQAHGAQIAQYPTHKDETDLELALLAVAERGCTVIRLVGGVGDRLDQTISNVYLLALPQLSGRDTRLVSGRQTCWLAHPGETIIEGAPGDTLSLIPLTGEAAGILTDGLEYPLRYESLFFGPARGVSNVMLSEQARFTFERGTLLVVHTHGKA